ncbi:hypothetical protein LTR15_007259 [Elasticomyces elasticus]|nr:hypothetical protein LTR15_007259 [Elasticomyces elasticus]
MTKSVPWTYPQYQYLLVDPQPRDPGNGNVVFMKSPNRPRPSKPVQPRDDGQSRYIVRGKRNEPKDPTPRDPAPVESDQATGQQDIGYLTNQND